MCNDPNKEKEEEEKKEENSCINPYSFLHPDCQVAIAMMAMLNSND